MSSKQGDFLTFARITRAMAEGGHLTAEGFERLAAMALPMNGGGRYRRVHHAQASRILRDHMPNTEPPSTDSVKIWSDLHGDMQSQAEMTWPLEAAMSRLRR